jgi:hypothetical protein
MINRGRKQAEPICLEFDTGVLCRVYASLLTLTEVFTEMSEPEKPKPSVDDANDNCRQCGHPFNPHIVVAYDVNDFSKGGEIRCQWQNAVVSTT